MRKRKFRVKEGWETEKRMQEKSLESSVRETICRLMCFLQL